EDASSSSPLSLSPSARDSNPPTTSSGDGANGQDPTDDEDDDEEEGGCSDAGSVDEFDDDADGSNVRSADPGIAGDLVDNLATPTTSGTPSPQGTMTPAYSAMLPKHDREGTESPAWLLKLLMPVTDDQ
ncbi:unnamed protein product, partial [Pylaiella littoralis]